LQSQVNKQTVNLEHTAICHETHHYHGRMSSSIVMQKQSSCPLEIVASCSLSKPVTFPAPYVKSLLTGCPSGKNSLWITLSLSQRERQRGYQYHFNFRSKTFAAFTDFEHLTTAHSIINFQISYIPLWMFKPFKGTNARDSFISIHSCLYPWLWNKTWRMLPAP